MPGDPFKPANKKGGKKPRKSAPTTNPGPAFKAKSPMTTVTAGGAKSGTNMQGLIGQPSVSKTPHIQSKHQLPKGKTPKKLGASKGSMRGQRM